MMRRKFLFVLFSWLLFAPFAAPGALAASAYDSLQRLDAIRTEHFLICFPPEDADFARRTEINSEKALAELNGALGTNWDPKDFPILITHDIRRLNAYYQADTAGKIVLYRAVPTEGDLACFGDYEYSVVLHELTHALTLGIKSPAMDFFSFIIGEWFDNTLFLNYGMTEGYAVMAESLAGEGRANDPFTMNSIFQGMRSREILGYRRVSGALDEYPAAKTSYVFMGALLKYVCETYGREKMAEFTRRIPSSISTKGLFRDVYGISIDTAFDNFMASFRFPDVVPAEKLVGENSRYSNLILTESGLFFIDEIAGEVFKFDANGISSLISSREPVKIAFSHDGKFFGLLEYENDAPVLRIHDVFRSGMRQALKIKDVYDFAFASDGERNIVALYEYDGKDKSIRFLDMDSGETIDALLIGRGEDAFCLTQFENGKVAFISQKNLKCRIRAYDFKDRSLVEFSDDGDALKRNLSYDSARGRFLFSCAERGIDPEDVHFPRLGMLERSAQDGIWSFSFANEDADGGMLYPQVVGGNLVFISEGYKQDSINFLPLSSLSFRHVPAQVRSVESVESDDGWSKRSGEPLPDQNGIFRCRSFFKSFPFASPGALIFDMLRDGEGNSLQIDLGDHVVDPTGRYYSDLSLGYMFPLKSEVKSKHHIDLGYTHGLRSRNFDFSIGINPLFKFDDSVEDKSFHFDFAATASFAWTKRFASSSNYLALGASASYDIPAYESALYVSDGLGLGLSVVYRDTIQKGYGFRNTSGLIASLDARMNDVNRHFKNSAVLFFPAIIGDLRYSFARLIPVQNTRTLTFSLPLTLRLRVDYKYSPYQKNARSSAHSLDAAFSANLLLFSIDLSETFIDIPFTLNAIAFEFRPSVGYLNYEDKVNGKVARGFAYDFDFLAYVRLAPTFLGMMVTDKRLDIGLGYAIGEPVPGEGMKSRLHFYLAINGIELFSNSESSHLNVL